jgi:hypothetical protein
MGRRVALGTQGVPEARTALSPVATPKRILFAGSLAGHSVGYGGNTWAFLQWILGFRRLGCDVYYVEECRAGQSTDEGGRPVPFLQSASARYFRSLIDRYDLGDRAALLLEDSPAHVGLSRDDIAKVAGDVDLFLNQFGGYTAVLGRVRRSAYLDLDPGHTQIWQAQYGIDMRLYGHDVYFTIGLNLGEPGCPLPTCGIPWQKTVWPIVLSEWTTGEPPGSAFTTVANWRDYGWVQWQGVWYAHKAEAFKAVIDLPRRVSVPIEVCLSIADSDPELPLLRDNGWRLVSPKERIANPDAYRRYIHGSRGELTPVRPICSLAQNGWLSERSSCYLAAGRPVVMEDTGLGRHLPVGEGLLTYTDVESAAERVESVQRDYARHAEAARAFAREHLDSDRVLTRLMELCGV